MSKYAAYLHTIGLSQRNLNRIFKDPSTIKDFFENLSRASLEQYSLTEIRIDEIMTNYSLFCASEIDRKLYEKGVRIITIFDEDYPENLRNIPNPPFLLYVRGNLDNSKPLLSIVGSRECTDYSGMILKSVIPGLIGSDFGIVSGGAYGVDSIAHNITLNNNGYTLCIIGTGIDKDYPAFNRGLYDKIIQKGGAIISIFRPGTHGARENFPIRNEIIAGISKGTLVTEAREKSGTLITARLALELNKDVFVVPGDITREHSIGCNSLLRDGLAKAVMSHEDILIEYNLNSNYQAKPAIQLTFEDELEQDIYKLLKNNPLDASAIADKIQKDIDIVSSKLTYMEIGGLIILGSGGNYNIKQ